MVDNGSFSTQINIGYSIKSDNKKVFDRKTLADKCIETKQDNGKLYFALFKLDKEQSDKP